MTEKILENKKHGMRALIIIIALYASSRFTPRASPR